MSVRRLVPVALPPVVAAGADPARSGRLLAEAMFELSIFTGSLTAIVFTKTWP